MTSYEKPALTRLTPKSGQSDSLGQASVKTSNNVKAAQRATQVAKSTVKSGNK